MTPGHAIGISPLPRCLTTHVRPVESNPLQTPERILLQQNFAQRGLNSVSFYNSFPRTLLKRSSIYLFFYWHLSTVPIKTSIGQNFTTIPSSKKVPSIVWSLTDATYPHGTQPPSRYNGGVAHLRRLTRRRNLGCTLSQITKVYSREEDHNSV